MTEEQRWALACREAKESFLELDRLASGNVQVRDTRGGEVLANLGTIQEARTYVAGFSAGCMVEQARWADYLRQLAEGSLECTHGTTEIALRDMQQDVGRLEADWAPGLASFLGQLARECEG